MVARSVLIVSVLAISSTLAFSQARPRPGTIKDQVVYAPFWTVEPGWSTHLEVRNSVAAKSLTVIPVLRQFDGREIALPSRTLAPNQAVEFDVAQELVKVAPELVQKTGAYGSVLFKFTGPQPKYLRGLDGQHACHPIVFHFDAVMQDTAFNAGSQESIWWLPKESASDVLIIGNTGARTVVGTHDLYGPAGTVSRKNLSFGPGQTAKLDVRDLVRAAKLPGVMGGLRLTLSGQGGTIQVAHLVYDELGAYSAIVKPFDRGAATQIAERQYIAATVALTDPDPALALPDGTVLIPSMKEGTPVQ